MNNFISINLHIHDRDQFLNSFFDMLKFQTYKNFEINILETANLDSSISIIKQYKNDLNINCYRLHTKFVDRTKALNFLIKNSNGNVICITDIDVMKSIDYLEEVNNKINENVFLIQFVKYLDQRNTVYYLSKHNDFNKACKILEKQELNKGGKSQIAVLKNKLLEIGCYDESFFGWGYEDSDLYARLCMNGLEVKQLNSLGIHLWHNKTWIFNGFRKEQDNLKIHKDNLKNNIICVDNCNVIRLDNLQNIDLSEPVKIIL
jgi:teichuronic acid biosynthesis glycosyltransferase TuaG